MKLNEDIPSKDETEVHAQAEIKSQLKQIGRLSIHPGHKIWKINMKTLDVEEAKYEGGKTVVFNGKTTTKGNKRVVVEEGFYYIPAINVKNARKKYVKILTAHQAKRREGNVTNS